MTTALFLISINALGYDMEDVRRILQQQEAEQNKQLLIQAKQFAKKQATEQSFDTQNPEQSTQNPEQSTQNPEQSTQTIAIRRVYDMQTGVSHKEVVRSGGQQTNTVATQPHYNPPPNSYPQPIYFALPSPYPQPIYFALPSPYPQQGYDTQNPNQYAPNIDMQRGYDTQTNIPQR